MDVRPGYTVTGWYIDEELTKRINPGSHILDETVTLYPKFEPIIFKVDYKLPQGVNSRKNPKETWIDAGLMRLYPPVSFQDCFKGWYLDGKKIDMLPGGVDHDLVIEGRFCPRARLSFQTDTPIRIPDAEADSFGRITMPRSPIRPGYDFLGWSKVSNAADYFNPKHPLYSDMTLYAIWSEHRYPITVHTDQGLPESTIPSDYTINTPTILLPRVHKNSARFKGWVDARGNYRTMIRQGSMGTVELWADFDEPYAILDLTDDE